MFKGCKKTETQTVLLLLLLLFMQMIIITLKTYQKSLSLYANFNEMLLLGTHYLVIRMFCYISYGNHTEGSLRNIRISCSRQANVNCRYGEYRIFCGVVMIKSKQDYEFYLEADKIALGRKRKKPLFFGDDVWKFERMLRKVEYYHNCKKSTHWKPYILFLNWRYHLMGIKLGFTVPINVMGPGLSIAHHGTIIINGTAKVGDNCRIHTCVNIGTKAGYSDLAPKIGNNVYIGPGAKLFGDIEISDGIAIGANSVVNKSFLEPNISIAGVPAKK